MFNTKSSLGPLVVAVGLAFAVFAIYKYAAMEVAKSAVKNSQQSLKVQYKPLPMSRFELTPPGVTYPSPPPGASLSAGTPVSSTGMMNAGGGSKR